MLTNLLVKNFLSRLLSGQYTAEPSTIAFYPTINVRTATVTTKTDAYTVTLADLATPTIFNNAGDAGDLPLTLPSAASAKGKVVRVHALAAQTISLTPVTGDIINYNGSAVASKYARLAGVIGNYAELFSDGTQWIVTQSSGVITKEA
jgi:hypothetical protein